MFYGWELFNDKDNVIIQDNDNDRIIVPQISHFDSIPEESSEDQTLDLSNKCQTSDEIIFRSLALMRSQKH
jgi:hypothetical protein